ncbi:uncharacterized protein LOC105663707 [Megachile rotundata]|uniref:uncharacterized protein LOC105663707 n=1 Tax=Megachile rotundata TaxID=143995 RepID=UPI003FD094FC
MKYLVIVFLITLQLRHAWSAKLESKANQTKLGQPRIRVHRVSYPINEESYGKNIMNEGAKQLFPLENKALLTFSEKLQSTLPDLSDLIQREAQLFKELNVILKELPREEATKLKNVDFAVNEMDIATSASMKSMLKNTNHLDNNLLNSPEELSVYHQEQSRSPIESSNDPELKVVNNIAQYLDNVLMEIRNHITYVRAVFEKLCRKHNSLTRNANMEANQPKKVSIL